jgi:hypothetical protein
VKPGVAIVGLLAACLGAAPALAQQSPSAPPEDQAQLMHRSLDKNGDGVISPAEAAGTPIQAAYGQMDINDDGRLTLDEYRMFLLRSGPRPAQG